MEYQCYTEIVKNSEEIVGVWRGLSVNWSKGISSKWKVKNPVQNSNLAFYFFYLPTVSPTERYDHPPSTHKKDVS